MIDTLPTGSTPTEQSIPDRPGNDLTAEDRRYRVALDRAMRLLAQREHSVRELIGKLTARGVDAATAGLVVDDLRGRGLQSDARFTESFVRSRIGRGQGPVRIRHELSQRGVDDALVSEALSDCADEWLTQIRDVRERKFGDVLPRNRNEWGRQARFLAQRGFPSDLVYRVLGQSPG